MIIVGKVKQKKKSSTKKQPQGIESRLKDLTDFEEPIITVIWGRSGHGKTTTASTWPKPMLIVDVNDKGSESAKSIKLKKGDITVFEAKNADDLEEIIDFVDNNPTKYRTIVIDHLTQVQEFYKDRIMEEEGKKKMTQPMFGTLSGYMKEFIMRVRSLNELGVYPVMLAQDRTDEVETPDEELLDPDIGPAMTPAVQKFLIASSKIVGRQYIASYQKKIKVNGIPKKVPVTEYRLFIGPNPYYATKIRKPQGAYCPEYLVNPNFNDLVAITKGEYKEPKESVDKPKKKNKK
jgi:hypothetical protein